MNWDYRDYAFPPSVSKAANDELVAKDACKLEEEVRIAKGKKMAAESLCIFDLE